MGTPMNNAEAKRAYSRPSLTIYGSVRDLTGTFSGPTSLDSSTMMVSVSDPACKENIVRVADHPAGFGLYLFDYKPEYRDACGHGRKFGVMADEVEKIVPDAVVVNDYGYRAVDYARLGIVLH
jgi:hypothetical protein